MSWSVRLSLLSCALPRALHCPSPRHSRASCLLALESNGVCQCDVTTKNAKMTPKCGGIPPAIHAVGSSVGFGEPSDPRHLGPVRDRPCSLAPAGVGLRRGVWATRRISRPALFWRARTGSGAAAAAAQARRPLVRGRARRCPVAVAGAAKDAAGSCDRFGGRDWRSPGARRRRRTDRRARRRELDAFLGEHADHLVEDRLGSSNRCS